AKQRLPLSTSRTIARYRSSKMCSGRRACGNSTAFGSGKSGSRRSTAPRPPSTGGSAIGVGVGSEVSAKDVHRGAGERRRRVGTKIQDDAGDLLGRHVGLR